MSNQPETPEEIQDEMRELGIDNDATGSPDLFISGPAVKVGAGILVALLVFGALVLVF
ncbi:MAG TPA: hypothetical protein VMF31_12230 [Solirubrobacterales bacterium]|nr:hypothetical protein [Solirubrobacterales bacterium]